MTLPHQKFVFTSIGIFLVVLALLMPVWDVAEPATYIGGLLVWSALLEILHGFRRAEVADRNSAWISGAITLVIGTLLINAILFNTTALIDFILGLFLIDALRYLYLFFRKKRTTGKNEWTSLLSALGNTAVFISIMYFRGKGPEWIVGLAGALRIMGTVYNLYTARTGTQENVAEDVAVSLGFKGDKDFEQLAIKLRQEADHRAPIDTGWIIMFIVILFFIHLGRMGLDRSALGILSPLVSVLGDICIALIVSFGLVAPLRRIFRKLTRSFSLRLWNWIQKVPHAERSRFGLRAWAYAWVKNDLSIAISMRKSGYSFITAFRNGLKIGLPFAALLAAVMPVLGMSWYFDTENWASGVWDGWAGSRAEVWREAMIRASGETGPQAFRLYPPRVNDTTDFSFVVIGDTGEGDPSQHVLKDQLLAVSNKHDINFVVISSDIIYPSGAMKDYERKFFLPFKGLRKPVYAIPGNHDWYDALDGFVATFFKPDAARKAMEARANSDMNLTSTNQKMINSFIQQASFLRKEYQVDVGHQDVPFFQVSNDYFVLLTIDTGVRRRLDSLQLNWVKSVLEASKGKYVMALLGHPFYAIGEYQGNMSPEFRALHEMLRAYKVPLIMAGDTHDLEYYKEPPQGNDGHTMHHFVNGGGGAYLSIGASMAPEGTRPTKDWATYPSREPLMHKIDTLTPAWKYPAWVWLKKYHGYPFSAEWLSAAFDYNQAPYFQSFMEIKVERSMKRIRLIPYGVHGQLKWSDFAYGGEVKPRSAKDNGLVEWVLPM